MNGCNMVIARKKWSYIVQKYRS